MNREIKFRAWNEKTKIMRDNPIAICNIGGGINTIFSTDYPHYRWMEYTGLIDKNGVEIFEGDVLSMQGHWSIRIEFDKGMRVRDLDRVRYNNKRLGCYVYDFDFTGWTIVGNIYENPELLEGK